MELNCPMLLNTPEKELKPPKIIQYIGNDCLAWAPTLLIMWRNSEIFVFVVFFILFAKVTKFLMVFISFFAYFHATVFAAICNMKLGSTVPALESLFAQLFQIRTMTFRAVHLRPFPLTRFCNCQIPQILLFVQCGVPVVL
jgi:hypothetical protein